MSLNVDPGVNKLWVVLELVGLVTLSGGGHGVTCVGALWIRPHCVLERGKRASLEFGLCTSWG